jgi:hypothetical protein
VTAPHPHVPSYLATSNGVATEHIYPSGASSLDVRTCEGCGEVDHVENDNMRRCAGCRCWTHEGCCTGRISKTTREWFCCADCAAPYRTEALRVREYPAPLSTPKGA